jgi:hypothetical protein
MTRSAQTVRAAIESGYPVDALCHECGHLTRLDLAKLSTDGHTDTVLISLPVVCKCGSRRSQILVID